MCRCVLIPRENVAGDESGVNLGEVDDRMIRRSCGMFRLKIYAHSVEDSMQHIRGDCVRMGCRVKFESFSIWEG